MLRSFVCVGNQQQLKIKFDTSLVTLVDPSSSDRDCDTKPEQVQSTLVKPWLDYHGRVIKLAHGYTNAFCLPHKTMVNKSRIFFLCQKAASSE